MPPPPETEGKWRIINPLSVRYSQPRIARHFRDGHLLHETAAQFSEVPLEVIPEHERPVAKDSASGQPSYDTVLLPPFPAIRIISWRPKLRRPDGEAERDEYGDQILGKRAWFALDNRRLYSLQQAAAKRWPKVCAVVVQCIEEVPGTTIKELRKFRTTTEGKRIQMGARTSELQDWDWTMGVPGHQPEESEVEPDGHYAEELFDAEVWAPRAVVAAQRPPSPPPIPVEALAAAAAAEKEPDSPAEDTSPPFPEAPSFAEMSALLEQVGATTAPGTEALLAAALASSNPYASFGGHGLHGAGGYPNVWESLASSRNPWSNHHHHHQHQHHHALSGAGLSAQELLQLSALGGGLTPDYGMSHFGANPLTQRLAAAAMAREMARERPSAPPRPQASRLGLAPPTITALPSTGWQYVDPSGKIQGPFSLEKMKQWHAARYFSPTLPMRCDPADEFVPFAELWAPGTPPFTLT
eukprot:CAMPEP_0206563546 /NCGR_PEP_ID=MMETSP0325_2-20121206/22914_1 /ASSEMBLY_ACC=CAM_ASM_000347 /TAXON_ID=2866 /ORGANISM="Crypthecodinium cohnii, Strain Seligo" /LENGTH=468 /DNA_ID=CAMNT_0054065979 /DNA_START=522 /DNA_END=1925 /DNA_ORIENTATION=-